MIQPTEDPEHRPADTPEPAPPPAGPGLYARLWQDLRAGPGFRATLRRFWRDATGSTR